MSHKTTQLSPKHWKALELLEEGILSVKEIAATLGWSIHTMYDMMSGNISKGGYVAELFSSELKKISERNNAKSKYLSRENKSLALQKMNEYLRDIQKKKVDNKKLDKVITIINSLAKMTPGVEIGQLTYKEGLSKEDLANEFKRLSAAAHNSLNGGRIQRFGEEGPGIVSSLAGAGSPLEEESTAAVLRPQSEN